MLELLYNMAKESPSSFLFIKGIRDNEDNFKMAKVIDANKSFCNLFNIELDCVKNYIITPEDIKNRGFDLNIALKNVIENKKGTLKKYIETHDIYVTIEVFAGNDDVFGLRINKIEQQLMKLSSALINSPFYTWIKDLNGRYIDANKSFLKLINKEYDEIIGKTSAEIWPEKDFTIFENRCREAIAKDTLLRHDNFNIFSSNIHIETSICPYKDFNNMILGTMGIAINMSEKKLIQYNIKKNEEYFLAVASNIEEVLMIKENGKYTYISPSFENMFGESPKKLYENTVDLPHYAHEDDLYKFYTYNVDEPFDIKFRVKNCDDKWILCKSVPIKDEHGKTVKRLGVLVDISKSKIIEDELNELKIDFFTNLSHELRTPIHLVLSAVQLLDKKLVDCEYESSNFLAKYLSIIHQNGLRLLKLINNLIDTTKIDSGQFSYNPQNYDIVSFVENICTSVIDFVEINNLNLIFDTNVEEKVIAFDLDNMERVILNLISNAIKFNKPNGTIEVSINVDESVFISIKDNGIGIPKHKAHSVFERFEQVDTKIKKEKEGSGIGLSLVKSLVEINGGSVKLKTEINQGSEFIIKLPNKKLDIDTFPKINLNDDSIYNKRISNMSVEFSDIYI